MSHFNKRHYEAIALVMQDAHKQAAVDNVLVAVDLVFHIQEEFAAMFSRDNPLFNRGRFLCACTPGANVRAKTAHLKIWTTEQRNEASKKAAASYQGNQFSK